MKAGDLLNPLEVSDPNHLIVEAMGTAWNTEILLKHKKPLFYCEGGQTLEEVAWRGCVESPSLETFETYLDIVLCSLL